MNRNYSDHYDPDLTVEDMGRPTRAEAARDERDRSETPPAPGPLVDAVREPRRVWDGRGEE